MTRWLFVAFTDESGCISYNDECTEQPSNDFFVPGIQMLVLWGCLLEHSSVGCFFCWMIPSIIQKKGNIELCKKPAKGRDGQMDMRKMQCCIKQHFSWHHWPTLFLVRVYQLLWLCHGSMHSLPAAHSASASLPLHSLFGLKHPHPAFMYISDTKISSLGLHQKPCLLFMNQFNGGLIILRGGKHCGSGKRQSRKLNPGVSEENNSDWKQQLKEADRTLISFIPENSENNCFQHSYCLEYTLPAGKLSGQFITWSSGFLLQLDKWSMHRAPVPGNIIPIKSEGESTCNFMESI